jgi:hypothetical protein
VEALAKPDSFQITIEVTTNKNLTVLGVSHSSKERNVAIGLQAGT